MKYKIVCIDWEDSSSEGGWMPIERALTHTIANCQTVGFLLRKTKKEVSIIQSISDTENVCEPFAIPRRCIKRMTVLEALV